jgi:hypothetical protein
MLEKAGKKKAYLPSQISAGAANLVLTSRFYKVRF